MPFRNTESPLPMKRCSLFQEVKNKRGGRSAQDYRRAKARYSTGMLSGLYCNILSKCMHPYRAQTEGIYPIALLKAPELNVTCMAPLICWPPQGSEWTSEQKVAVDKALDWRQRPGSIPRAVSNTAGYLCALKTFWYFPAPGGWTGASNHNPLSVLYYRVTSAAASKPNPIWSALQRGEGRRGKQILFEVIQRDRSWPWHL